jgi:pilus assembly protein CpaD
MVVRQLFPLCVALALAACAAPSPDIAPSNSMASLHVDRVRVQYAAAFTPGGSDLPYGEAMRLETFLDQAGLRPDDRVYIASPCGDRLAAARVERITALLARRGIGTVAVAPPAAGIAPNHVVVLADRYVVTPPTCPDWSDSPATGHANTPNSNFGCATVSNFALMVDNPRDLMTGRALGPADAEPSIESVERYRTGQLKPLLNSVSKTQAAAGASGSPGSSGSGPSGAESSSSGAGSAAATAATGAAGMSSQ